MWACAEPLRPCARAGGAEGTTAESCTVTLRDFVLETAVAAFRAVSRFLISAKKLHRSTAQPVSRFLIQYR